MSLEKGESSKNEEKVDTREAERMGGSNPGREVVEEREGRQERVGIEVGEETDGIEMVELREGREFKE